MSFHGPLGHRSNRSTPSGGVSPFHPPADDGAESTPVMTPTVVEETAEPIEPAEKTKDVETEPVSAPMRPSLSQEGGRPRPTSRVPSSYTNTPSKGPIPRPSIDADIPVPLNGSISKSQKSARFRDDWGDFDFNVDPREYAAFKEYERYWRGDMPPERYVNRRSMSFRPPPSILNNRRYIAAGQDSDEETYDERRYSRDPFDTPRVRRNVDEEAAYYPPPSQPFLRREMSSATWGVRDSRTEWNSMSKREKAEVMRLPLTEWMNSSVKNHFVATLGEFVGTTMFLFFAFAGTEVANIRSEAETSNTTTGEATGFNIASLLYISLSFGFSLMVNVWIFFRISGGLFNPAVTCAMLMVGAIPVVRAVCLFVAQMTGAMLASVIVRFLFPESFNVRTTLGGGAAVVQGVFIEGILTAELVFTILMLAKEKHRSTFIAPVGIGLALFIAEMVGVQFTGGSLNPARSFGPCVVTGEFDSEHWIYWVGPLVGSIIAVLFYRFIKTLEYEMANPGADGDDHNDPTKNPEKRAEIQYANAPSRPPSLQN